MIYFLFLEFMRQSGSIMFEFLKNKRAIVASTDQTLQMENQHDLTRKVFEQT